MKKIKKFKLIKKFIRVRMMNFKLISKIYLLYKKTLISKNLIMINNNNNNNNNNNSNSNNNNNNNNSNINSNKILKR